ncbi:MAG: tellurite resistance TerB family protein [Bauldia sp.]|nr:tellurite resistance TerB family protein [Bauldia sp.]
MFDPKQLLDQVLGGGRGPGAAASDGGVMGRVGELARQNPMLAGGIAGGLAGLLLGRGFGGGLIKYGGMAVIGGLAYKAWRDYQDAQSSGEAPAGGENDADLVLPPPDSPFVPTPQSQARLAETLIVAMIAAAKADGHIDAEERGRIYQRLEEGGLQPEEVAFLQRELTEPVDVDRIVAGARTKEEAVEVYAASLMAIRNDTPQERDYLAGLAGRLQLEPDLVTAIEKTVESVSGR